jgi:hypothetical protein
VLVDNDPWGLYIYSVLKQGSINLAYESMRMAVPERALPRHELVRLREVQADERGRDQAEERTSSAPSR